MLFGFRKTTMLGQLLRLREVAKEPLVDLGPVNLGVDHLIIDKLLFPWGYDLLRVEPQSVDRGFDGEPLSSFSSTSSSFSEPTFLH